ncbi:MAG TPA: acetoacetate decarboxylase [Leptospiraceae bacterium]|nr:acetoacetate decarboxylase [Leptospiraceae bacterium]HMY69451.1 acetoacetate decarboxylase [Leptospiraceae bacterium]HMZ57630.1 acetoacetate decarboxylase [Leptospiraceae bacterium]HNF13146.1 acetoacetate decarboxylase [Leptospiraceae bacterium]HNF24392.1 acetoacetate decarboxylase [Leptospiraceae bacterium]
MNENGHFPPPWNLDGEGFLLPFWADKKHCLQSGFISESEKDSYRGGLGAVMLVNYRSSDVGPYFELLFIPGDFHHSGKTYKKITKIYVSSQKSVEEGILNWAIPKELAEFSWKKTDKETKIDIQSEKGSVLTTVLKEKFFSFPVTTSLFPFTLLQKAPESLLATKFIGKGSAKFAGLESYSSNPAHFPDIYSVSSFRLPGLAVSPFALTFPVPEVLK